MNAYSVYVIYIKPSMPEWLHERAARLWWRCARLTTRYFLWRIKPLPTQLLGPLWRRSRDEVEVDITYACNLKCFNCNRSCQQDPTGDRMSTEQIQTFPSREPGTRYSMEAHPVSRRRTNEPSAVSGNSEFVS